MMKKTTVKVSSDVALVKYWGRKDEKLRLPENGSISIILDGLDTVTTVEFQPELTRDDVTIEGESRPEEVQRVVEHLDRIRAAAGISTFARVVSTNSFPKSTGLSSSSSAFAALTVAAARAAGLQLSEKTLSILARQGSGSACRCVCGGFVEWLDGATSETSFSQTLYPASYWDVRDVVVVVDEGRKKVSSTEGHKTAQSSPFYPARQQHIGQKILDVKHALRTKNFGQLGELVEAEALEFHSILLTSQPPMIAWYPGTIQVMLEVRRLREEGIPAYFTINTGFNVHVLTLPEYETVVADRLKNLDLVKHIFHAKVGNGPQEVERHLF